MANFARNSDNNSGVQLVDETRRLCNGFTTLLSDLQNVVGFTAHERSAESHEKHLEPSVTLSA